MIFTNVNDQFSLKRKLLIKYERFCRFRRLSLILSQYASFSFRRNLDDGKDALVGLVVATNIVDCSVDLALATLL